MQENIHLPRLYAAVSDANLIDVDLLPEKFVIKTSDGGNGDNVMIVKDKSQFDLKKSALVINSWKNRKYEVVSREWAYSGNKETIIMVEELLEDDNTKDKTPLDYKFFCFDGKVKCFKIDFSRFSGHRANYYDRDGCLIDVDECVSPRDTSFSIPESVNISSMIKIAEKFATPFPFVRVDLYNIKGEVYFGELTFYPMSGFGKFSPDSFDEVLGKSFTLY